MGKMLESLRRTAPPVPVHERPRLADLPREAVAERAPTDDWSDAPFVEVPEIAAPKPTRPAVSEPVSAPESTPAAAITFTSQPALIPRLEAPAALTVWREPHGPIAEQYRRVRDALLARLADEQSQTLLFLPISATVEVAPAVLNLAAVLVERTSDPVLVIDSDPHVHSLANCLKLAPALGWAEVLAGLPAATVVQESGLPGLHLMAAGNRLAARPAARSGQRVQETLAELAQDHRRILIVSMAGELSPGDLVLATACDGVCLIHAGGKRQPEEEARRLDAFQRIGARAAGTLVVGGSASGM